MRDSVGRPVPVALRVLQQLKDRSEMAEFLPVRYSPTAPARGRHNVNFRPAESVVLQAVFALSPHELLVNDLAVEHDYFRTTDCFQFPIEDLSTPDELRHSKKQIRLRDYGGRRQTIIYAVNIGLTELCCGFLCAREQRQKFFPGKVHERRRAL